MTATAIPHSRRDRPISLDEAMRRTGLGRSTIYRRESAGTLARPVSAGTASVRWRESAIDAWISSLPEVLGNRRLA
jgi:prophage regulatory protein